MQAASGPHVNGLDFDSVICRKIKDFMHAKFPFWLEVLSLLGQVAGATNALKSTGIYLEVLSHYDSICL
jgi:hypothetical protein